MADPCPAPLSFRPPSRITRDEEFDERLFDEVAVPFPAGSDPPAVEDADAEEEPPSAREGLPAGFRMRADAHYVEQLVTRRLADPILLIPVGEIDGPHPLDDDLQPLVRSVSRVGILQPLLVRRQAGRYELISGVRRLAAALAAGLSEVPCLVYSADDVKARELADAANLLAQEQPEPAKGAPLPASGFGELTEQLGAIDACLHLFGDGPRPTRERVGITLIRTEVRRAVWLTQALAVLSAEPTVARQPVELGPLVQRLVAALAPERALSGVAVNATSTFAGSTCGDAQLLAIAVGGLIEAVQAASERAPGSQVALSVAEDRGGAVRVEAALDGQLPAALRPAFLDLQSTDRPGGARATVGLAAASRIAQLHGGRVTATDGGGSLRIVLWLPGPSERAS